MVFVDVEDLVECMVAMLQVLQSCSQGSGNRWGVPQSSVL